MEFCMLVSHGNIIIGASAVQMQSHFGWKSPQMAMEYVTKSKTAIKDVAALLSKGEEDGDHKEDVREGNGQVLVGVIWYGLLIIILFRRR